MLLVLVIALTVCALLLLWYALANRRRIDSLREASRKKLTELESEHDSRIKRIRRKFADKSKRGHLDFANDMLPALDALGRALELARDGAEAAALEEGLQMVDRELESVLAKHDITRCRPSPGEAFDPNLHEAVGIVETDEIEPGHVVECFRPGYVHAERVLRAAAVTVARQAPEALEAPADVGGEAKEAEEVGEAEDDEGGADAPSQPDA